MRKLKNIAVHEISILLSGPPAVPGARLLVAKGRSFLEDPGTLEVLRQLDKVVEGLKAKQAEKERAAAHELEVAARKQTPKRYRVFDTYEAYESSAAQARRMNARREFYAECKELAEHNRNKPSDLFR